MSEIKEGTPEKEVLRLLGKPDDIRTQHDPGGITTFRTKEIWCYGTIGHLTFPTLGCVYIDVQNKAQYVFGGGADTPDPALLPEKKLAELLRLIDRAPRLAGYLYDPLPVIQIVNALQPLGQDTALAVIDEYLRVASKFHSDAREGLFLVLRVLFDIPDDPGYMPNMYVGAPYPKRPEDPKSVPRFPVLLLDDVPLMLVSGYSLAGHAEHVESHVDYFRKNGRLRAKPLVPTNDPLGVYDQFERSFLWVFTDDGSSGRDGRLMVMNQLLRLVDSVYRAETDGDGDRIAGGDDLAERWKQHIGAIAKFEMSWDGRKNCYSFKDGSTLPPVQMKHYRREIWKLDGLEGDAQVILERLDSRRVMVIYEWSGKTGTKLKPATVRVIAKESGTRLAELSPTSVGATAGDISFSVQQHYVELEEGTEVQIELTVGDESKVSPTYKP